MCSATTSKQPHLPPSHHSNYLHNIAVPTGSFPFPVEFPPHTTTPSPLPHHSTMLKSENPHENKNKIKHVY